MANVATESPTSASDLASLVREHLDEIVTFATHLTGHATEAMEFVAAGMFHARRYPPAKLQHDGKGALYRSVTRACKQEQHFPPRPRGFARFVYRRKPGFTRIDAHPAERMNTVKRVLMTLPFERRAVLLLRDLGQLNYHEIGTVLEISPESVARLLAASRREFGTMYRELAL